MNKKFNYNYVFIMYDVNEIRVNKVFKICKKYLNHYQNSIFRGAITPSKIISLKNEINTVINKDEDVVSIIKMISNSSFEEENLGKEKVKSESMFL